MKRRLEAHILAALDEIEDDRQKRRDPMGITLAIMFIALSALAGVWALSAGGWWLLSLIPVVLGLTVGAVGLAQDAPRRRRDVKGNPVKPNPELPSGNSRP